MLSSETTVHLSAYCPFDKNYENVINPSKINIGTYYGVKSNKGQYTLFTDSYAMMIKKTGAIRVKWSLENVEKCSYMHWYNWSEQMDYYAWIDDARYISDGCTEIIYTIDIWNTWVKSGWDTPTTNTMVYIQPCMIIREHVASENFFFEYAPENFNIGAYVSQRYQRFSLNNSLLYENGAIFVTSNTPNGNGSLTDLTKIYGNQFMGLYYEPKYQRSPYASGMYDNYISQFQSHPDDIVGIFSCPYWLASGATYDNHYMATDDIDVIFQLNKSKWRNMKCYTYPYTRLIFSNQNGSQIEFNPCDLMYQDKATSSTTQSFYFRFHVVGGIAPTPEVFCYPTNYRGLASNMDYGLKLSNFPACAWASDYFLNWWSLNKAGIDYSNSAAQRNAMQASAMNTATSSLAQQSNLLSGISNMTGQASSTVGNLLTGNNTGLVGNAMSIGSSAMLTGIGSQQITLNENYKNQQITNSYKDTIFANTNSINQAMLQPNPVHGSTSSGSLDYSIPNKCGYLWYQEEQRFDLMQYIDDFFSLYGYAKNQVAIPQTQSRKHFNYVQTNGDLFTSRNAIYIDSSTNKTTNKSVPNIVLKKLNEIANRGFRVWNSDINNYGYFSSTILNENKLDWSI